MRIDAITIWRLKVPLIRPYHLTGVVLSELDVLLAEARGPDGQAGCGEAVIIPGYTDESVDEGWTFCREQSEALIGLQAVDAEERLDAWRPTLPHAVTVLRVAVEMMRGHPLFEPPAEPVRIPLSMAVMSQDPADIAGEVEGHLTAGHRTLKLKGGWDRESDLARLQALQRAAAGRARIRFDANQGYSRDAALALVDALDPEGIESIEQPCAADDWEANAAVAAASPVPLKLDESIYAETDIDRAAAMDGCGYVKMMLVKQTGVGRLKSALDHIRAVGLGPILGNGAATDVNCWAEACVARHTIDTAGEMNGFLKNRENLLERPLRMEDGSLVLEPDFEPHLDHARVNRMAVARDAFGAGR
jgi:L-alanine-DL-glutamate epimerase-like enolase superfamily enzyme